jgi:Acyl-CoA carboxylase epsilon subunit
VSDEQVEETPPLLRIVKGDATPEELAALVAVVAALGSGGEPPARRTPEWSAHHRKMRRSLPHGPGGWRSSGLPR